MRTPRKPSGPRPPPAPLGAKRLSTVSVAEGGAAIPRCHLRMTSWPSIISPIVTIMTSS
jgi:hypothetical protein